MFLVIYKARKKFLQYLISDKMKQDKTILLPFFPVTFYVHDTFPVDNMNYFIHGGVKVRNIYDFE